jgi:hypothetical protein
MSQLLHFASTLPRFQAPEIRYETPRWHAHVNGLRTPTITVRGSTRIEAKFQAAARFGCSVQIVIVEPAYDRALSRLNRVA